MDLPMIGANLQEFPIIGSSFGPGISEYGLALLLLTSLLIKGTLKSFDRTLIEDENVERLKTIFSKVRRTSIFN